jgi:hypothetical protein
MKDRLPAFEGRRARVLLGQMQSGRGAEVSRFPV